jgi:hypothetical protein
VVLCSSLEAGNTIFDKKALIAHLGSVSFDGT